MGGGIGFGRQSGDSRENAVKVKTAHACGPRQLFECWRLVGVLDGATGGSHGFRLAFGK